MCKQERVSNDLLSLSPNLWLIKKKKKGNGVSVGHNKPWRLGAVD